MSGTVLAARGRLAATEGGRPPTAPQRWTSPPAPHRVVIGLAASIPIAVYLWIALHRVSYPYELDWMEGGSVELAARVAAGHSLYVAPSLAFVGWTYTPLYYVVAAAVAKVIGIGFLALRLVSLAASVAAMVLLGLVVVRETGDRLAGLLAAGVFAAAFRVSGAWFDIGRVDSLSLALTLGAIAAGRCARRRRDGIALGVLVFLAYFTKQSALVALAPVLAWVVVSHPRAGVPAIAVLLGLVAGSTLVLDALTHDWYRYYVFDELAGQPWAPGVWVSFWTIDLVSHLWPALGLAAAGAARHAARGRPRWGEWPGWRRSGAVYYGAVAAGLIASAWASRLHTGGYANVLMPAYAAVALVAGLAFAGLSGACTGRTARVTTAVIVVAQIALLAYPVGAQIPTATDRALGGALIRRVRAVPGPVLVLRHPWYGTAAGRGSFAQEEALGDVLRSSDPRGARALRADLRSALDADHIQAVILDGTFDAALLEPELSRDFRQAPGAVTPRPLYPVTDVRTAPTLLYVRLRSTPPTGASLRTRPPRRPGATPADHRTPRRAGTLPP